MVSLARFVFYRRCAFENGFEPAPEIAPLGAPLPTTHRVISYTYDSLYRLITATYSSGEYYTYTYDAVGNRLSLTTHQDVVNYGYDAANRLTSVNGQAYTWDNNGNLLSDGTHTYSYDHANRLTQVVSGTLTTEFVYNGAGDRVAKTVDGVTTDYVLDGSTGLTTGPAAGLTQVLQETTDGQATSYLYGADLLAQYDSGTWAYHVNDGLGSVRQLVDAAGEVQRAQSYDPFGNLLSASGSAGTAYGYTGEQWDAEVELLYLRARYYSPQTGRFITEDRAPGYVRVPQSLHVYAYAWNNPVLLTDPGGWQVPPEDCQPGEICAGGTTGPYVVPSEPVPPTISGPGNGTGPHGDLVADLVEGCYLLYKGEEREACLEEVHQLPPMKPYVRSVCAPEPQTFLVSAPLEGDPISAAGMGERKYSYVKTSAQQVILALFLGGAHEPLEKMLALVGGTYLSKLVAEVVVYDNGTLTQLHEEYNARTLYGVGVGVDVSVARAVEVRASDGSRYNLYPFDLVSAGEQGVTEEKEVWMNKSQGRIPSEALMRIAVSAEGSFPLLGGGYGWSYSLSLLP